MSDESTSAEAGGVSSGGEAAKTGGDGEQQKGDRAHMEKLIAERDDAKRKLRDIEKAAKEREDGDRKAAEELALAKGEHSKVLESKETTIAKLTEQLADATGKVQAWERRHQENLLISDLDGGRGKSRQIRGAYLTAREDGLLGDVPDDPKQAAEHVREILKKTAPELFDETPPGQQGQPPPRASGDKPAKHTTFM